MSPDMDEGIWMHFKGAVSVSCRDSAPHPFAPGRRGLAMNPPWPGP